MRNLMFKNMKKFKFPNLTADEPLTFNVYIRVSINRFDSYSEQYNFISSPPKLLEIRKIINKQKKNNSNTYFHIRTYTEKICTFQWFQLIIKIQKNMYTHFNNLTNLNFL